MFLEFAVIKFCRSSGAFIDIVDRNDIISGCIGINITRNQDTAVPFPYN